MGLRLLGLKKSFVAPDGSVLPVIDIDCLEVTDGQQVALVGASGTGKTTLLHLIAGILTPDSGQILFDLDSPGGRTVDLARLSEAQRDIFRGQHIGYIFQRHHLLAGLTAMENVLLGMSFAGRPADRRWARHLLQQVGLSDRLDYKPGKLSVGQQQRVAVARALANRPKLVLADEPTGSLDVVNAGQVLDLIRSLTQEVKATLLLVSHDPQVTNCFPRILELAEINRATAAVGQQLMGRYPGAQVTGQ